MKQSVFMFGGDDHKSLFARVAEPGAAVKGVVIAIHGLGVHSGQFSHMEIALADAGYVFASFDLRGHGRSIGARGHLQSFEVVFDDLDMFLREMRARYPDAPCFLHGFSLGGNIVLNYILNRQPAIAGVCAVGPWLRLAKLTVWQRIKGFVAHIADAMHIMFVAKNDLRHSASTHDESIAVKQQKDPLMHSYISNRLFTEASRRAAFALRNARAWPKTLPLVIFHGDEDTVTDSRASALFASRADRAESFVSLCGFRHAPHIETDVERAIFFKWCATWMDECVAGDADDAIAEKK